MQNGEARPKLMSISAEGVPGALAKAEHYRFLNEPWQAESICRDVLAVEPNNQMALILLILALTDQFDGFSAKEVLLIAQNLTNEYHRAYYSGIIHERQAIAEFRRHPDWRSRRQVFTKLQCAMDSYQRARAIRPPDNDDSVLRWNACVRFLERNWGLQ